MAATGGVAARAFRLGLNLISRVRSIVPDVCLMITASGSVRSIMKGAIEALLVCYGKRTVSKISRAYQGVTGGSVAQSKCQNAMFCWDLRGWEYASSNQGVGGSNPSGRTKIKKILRQPGPRDRKRADRTLDRQQDGSTTRRPAGLDVAGSAAAVRSEAEDERRSRKHRAAAALNAQRAAPKG
jgi:hypothetical protein